MAPTPTREPPSTTRPEISIDRLGPALRASRDRLERVVDSASDLSVRVPSTPEWTALQVLGHLVNVTERYAIGPEGGGTWAEVAPDLQEINAKELASLGDLGASELTATLRRSLESLIGQIESYADHQPTYRFHGGEIVRADHALGILLGEYLIHGRDLARALGSPWPLSGDEAAIVLDAVIPISPGWVDPSASRGHTATYELRLRGGRTSTIEFRDGSMRARAEPAPRADCRILADPVAFLLVMYRRESPWPFIARGRLLAWGRRPWLGLSLARRFHTP